MISKKVFYDEESKDIAKTIGLKLKYEMSLVNCKSYKNSDTYFEINEHVFDYDIIIVYKMYPNVNNKIMELLILINELKQRGANKISCVLPYFPYVRANQRFSKNTAVITNLISRLFKEVGVENIYSVELHENAIEGHFHNLYNVKSNDALVNAIKDSQINTENMNVIAADVLAIERSIRISENLKCPFIGLCYTYFDSKFMKKNKNIVISSSITGKVVLIVDTEMESGNSILNIASELKKKGAHKIYIAVTHCMVSSDFLKRKEINYIDAIFITDTIKNEICNDQRVKIGSIGQAIAEKILISEE